MKNISVSKIASENDLDRRHRKLAHARQMRAGQSEMAHENVKGVAPSSKQK